MVTLGKRILAVINYPRTFPVFLCALCSKQRNLIKMDLARWGEIDKSHLSFFEGLNWYLTYKKEFRNLLQNRFKYPANSPFNKIHFISLSYITYSVLFVILAFKLGTPPLTYNVLSAISAIGVVNSCFHASRMSE